MPSAEFEANLLANVLADVRWDSPSLSLSVEDEITVITCIEWIVRFSFKAQSHYSIAPWKINFVGHDFSWVLQFDRSHNGQLRVDGYNIASTIW